MNFIHLILIFILSISTTIIKAQDDIRFVITLTNCGLTVTVGVDECVKINACGYSSLKVETQSAFQGIYVGNLYSGSVGCTGFMPETFFIMCSMGGTSGMDTSVKCIRPGESSSSSSSGLSLSSITSSMTSAVTSISSAAAASSGSSAGGTGTSSSSPASILSSLSSSTASLLSSSSSSSSSTGGLPGSNCVKDTSKSQLTVTYNSNSPYIQCNGAMDLKCGSVTCFNQPNSTITCYGINNIQCTGSSFQCSIGDTQICNLNWVNPPDSSSDSSSDSSNSTIKASNSNKLQPFPFLSIIIISAIFASFF